MSSPNTSLLTTALFMLNASLSYQCENPPQQMLVGQKAWYTRVWVLPGPHFQFTLMYLVPSVKRFFINISRHFVAQTLAQSSCTIPILDKSRTAAESTRTKEVPTCMELRFYLRTSTFASFS